jgi:anti-sigma28 factor (negative regulator of flagellin synthesis)
LIDRIQAVKINDNKPVGALQTETKKGTQGGIATPVSSGSSAKAPGPAVNLSISPALSQGTSVLSETAALDKIRQMVESGQFKIDFPATAEQILRNAVSAIGGSKSSE